MTSTHHSSARYLLNHPTAINTMNLAKASSFFASSLRSLASLAASTTFGKVISCLVLISTATIFRNLKTTASSPALGSSLELWNSRPCNAGHKRSPQHRVNFCLRNLEYHSQALMWDFFRTSSSKFWELLAYEKFCSSRITEKKLSSASLSSLKLLSGVCCLPMPKDPVLTLNKLVFKTFCCGAPPHYKANISMFTVSKYQIILTNLRVKVLPCGGTKSFSSESLIAFLSISPFSIWSCLSRKCSI